MTPSRPIFLRLATSEHRFLAQNQFFIKIFMENSIEHTDICPTGGLLSMCFALVGAEHQLRRFIALKPKDG
jgi:hypothetical protein